MNLGEKLRLANIKRAEAQAAKRRDEERRAALADKQTRDNIIAKFESIKHDLVSRIENEQPVTPYVLTKSFEMKQHPFNVLIQDERHTHHDLWLDFKKWLDENGLIGKVEDAHDGMGVKSWHELVVLPKLVAD